MKNRTRSIYVKIPKAPENIAKVKAKLRWTAEGVRQYVVDRCAFCSERHIDGAQFKPFGNVRVFRYSHCEERGVRGQIYELVLTRERK